MAAIASTIKKNVNAIAPWAPDETLEDDPPMDWENWDPSRDSDEVAALATGFIAGRYPRGQGMPSMSNRDNSPNPPSLPLLLDTPVRFCNLIDWSLYGRDFVHTCLWHGPLNSTMYLFVYGRAVQVLLAVQYTRTHIM